VALNTGSQRVAGTCFVSINGETIPVRANVFVNFGAELKEAAMGMDGLHGYKGTLQVPSIRLQITNRTDLDLKKLLQIEGGTVCVQSPGGKTYTLSDAFASSPGELDVGEGTMDLEYTGRNLIEH